MNDHMTAPTATAQAPETIAPTASLPRPSVIASRRACVPSKSASPPRMIGTPSQKATQDGVSREQGTDARRPR